MIPECDCCAHIWAEGRSRHVAAEYIWTCQPSGNEIPLCASCTASWRANAAEDPSLTPARIRSIGVAA